MSKFISRELLHNKKSHVVTFRIKYISLSGDRNPAKRIVTWLPTECNDELLAVFREIYSDNIKSVSSSSNGQHTVHWYDSEVNTDDIEEEKEGFIYSCRAKCQTDVDNFLSYAGFTLYGKLKKNKNDISFEFQSPLSIDEIKKIFTEHWDSDDDIWFEDLNMIINSLDYKNSNEFHYKARAECKQDMDNFKTYMNTKHPGIAKFESEVKLDEDGLLDVEFEFKSSIDLKSIQEIFTTDCEEDNIGFTDLHVILETVEYEKNYTGERNYLF
jgi:hypothetical protein